MSSSGGVGELDYQRAIDIARNTEGELNPTVAEYLDQAVEDIKLNIANNPDSYLMSKDEFAVFNYFRNRFTGPEAEQAVDRYWRAG